MNAPTYMTRIVDGRRYSVATATLLADDAYWDGSNFERHGRNRFLYRTKGGRYFQVTLTMWEREQDTLIPCSLEDARELYENWLTEHHVSYEEAFPDVTVEDA